LSLSIILIGQMRIITGIGNSVIAFYAADTGMEKILLQRQSPPIGKSVLSGELDNNAHYSVDVSSPGLDCDADHYCIRSVGIYRGIRRAIEAEY